MEVLSPDIGWKRELAGISGAPLNQCMQCGTCSAVCSLAPPERPFPRKEMAWSAWGLKTRLLGNPDVWLCHQCGDCSISCPRDVKPSDVIAAIRQKNYEHYIRPRFFTRMLSRPALLPVAVLIPLIVISGILLLAGTFRIPEGPVDYSAFFPHVWLNSTFTLITLGFYALALRGILRLWDDMKVRYPPSADTGNRAGRRIPAGRVLGEILTHSGFSGCGGSAKVRKWAHMGVFFGFALLIVVTLYAIAASWAGRYPLDPDNPFKIAGNVASLMIYAGLGIMAFGRLFNRRLFGKNTYPDWLLLISIFLLTLSGTLVQLARFGDWGSAYHLYFFHLVTVWFVIMYLPFTKLGHIFFRTTALLYARSIGRK